MNKPSISSNRSRSSQKSIQNILQDLEQRLPRYQNIVYVMSIESDKSKDKSSGSDLMDKLDPRNRYSSSNKNSTQMIAQERGGSFGVSNQKIPLQLHRNSSWAEERDDHSCDCYRKCLGQNCNCFKFLEPCVPQRCCKDCILIKNALLAEHQARQRQNSGGSHSVQPEPFPSVPPTQHYNSLSYQPPINMSFNGSSNYVQTTLSGSQHQIKSFQTAQSQTNATFVHRNIKPVQSFNFSVSQPMKAQTAQIVEASCACKKTRCLKMYCECFARRGFCSKNCSCQECFNREDSQIRSRALIENNKEDDKDKGCQCRKTRCQKKYCKCYASGEKCSKFCNCQNCNNMNQQLKAIRKRQSQAKEIKPQTMMIIEPCEQLPTDIQFEMPDFSKMSLQDHNKDYTYQ